MSKYYICTEAFAVTVYESLEEETEALRWGAMPQPELDKLKRRAEEEGARLKIPRGEDKWLRVGQRVSEDNNLFLGQSGANRKRRFFIPEDEVTDKRGPGRPRKVEVGA